VFELEPEYLLVMLSLSVNVKTEGTAPAYQSIGPGGTVLPYVQIMEH
jgi:hypothetical protein